MNRLHGAGLVVASVVLSTGCKAADTPDAGVQQSPQAVEAPDSVAPLSAVMADVAEKCRETRFRDDLTSEPDEIAPGVSVRITPAGGSHRFKLGNLARGRIIARLDKLGTTDYPNLALYGTNARSCWYVWEDDDSGEFRSKYVAWDGSGETPDRNFHLDLHPGSHGAEESRWKSDAQLGPQHLGAEDRSSIFALASFRVPDQGETILRTGAWMWTTCLANGCCRSRQ